jgi:CRP-like cAMP-binding protein
MISSTALFVIASRFARLQREKAGLTSGRNNRRYQKLWTNQPVIRPNGERSGMRWTGLVGRPGSALRREGDVLMGNLLTRKLELFGPLAADDRRMLDEVTAQPRQVGSRQDLIREGESPTDVQVVLSGIACRYKMLPDGKRSIFAYLVPGDFCDLNIFILKSMDHCIATLSPCTVVGIPRSRVLELSERPAIARALWWATLVDEATLREWLVNIGQRNAEARIAHLFCEINLRLQSVGLAGEGEFSLPITQAELADTMGLSTVHVNRSLQSLRAQGLITYKSGRLVIPNVERLAAACQFNPNYLHIGTGKSDDKAARA